MAPPHPAIKAMLICDVLIRDERTHKVSLIGITERIEASGFPLTVPTLCVYATVTDGQGDDRIRLDLRPPRGFGGFPHSRRVDVTLHDRSSVGELNFNLGGLVIQRAGRYELLLYANDRLVGTKSISVVQSLGGRA